MPMPGVTYADVEAAATALSGEGKKVTVRTVRDKLGTGSMGTITKHVAAWEASRPSVAPPAYELPPELVTSFAKEIRRSVDSRTASLQQELADAVSTKQLLAEENIRFEAEITAQAQELVKLTMESAEASARAEERAEENRRLGEAVRREQAAAEEARVETAKSRLKIEAQQEALKRLQDDLQVARASLEAVRTAAADERAARSAADKDAAVAKQRAEGEGRRADVAEARCIAAEAELDEANGALSRCRADLAAAEKAAAVAGERAESAAKRAELAAEHERAALLRLDALESRRPPN